MFLVMIIPISISPLGPQLAQAGKMWRSATNTNNKALITQGHSVQNEANSNA
jgi:hypothetical protein